MPLEENELPHGQMGQMLPDYISIRRHVLMILLMYEEGLPLEEYELPHSSEGTW